jgi:hypothetical protein
MRKSPFIAYLLSLYIHPYLHYIIYLYRKQRHITQSYARTTIFAASAGQVPRGSIEAPRPFHSGTLPVGFQPSKLPNYASRPRPLFISFSHFCTLSSPHFHTLRLKTSFHILIPNSTLRLLDYRPIYRTYVSGIPLYHTVHRDIWRRQACGYRKRKEVNVPEQAVSQRSQECCISVKEKYGLDRGKSRAGVGYGCSSLYRTEIGGRGRSTSGPSSPSTAVLCVCRIRNEERMRNSGTLVCCSC